MMTSDSQISLMSHSRLVWRNLLGMCARAVTPRPKPRRRRRGALQFEWLESRCLLTTYDVGPGFDYTSVGAVPWDDLQAGDTVSIHYRPEPYRELILISGQGTLEAPIRVQGIA